MLFASVALLLAAAPAAPTAPAADGRALYLEHCKRCHGIDGKAPPNYAKKGVVDFDDQDWQAARSDDEIRKVIREGSEGTLMEPFDKDLKPEQIDALVIYIRRWRKEPKP